MWKNYFGLIFLRQTWRCWYTVVPVIVFLDIIQILDWICKVPFRYIFFTFNNSFPEFGGFRDFFISLKKLTLFQKVISVAKKTCTSYRQMFRYVLNTFEQIQLIFYLHNKFLLVNNQHPVYYVRDLRLTITYLQQFSVSCLDLKWAYCSMLSSQTIV